MNLLDTACTPGQVRQVGHHKLIHQQSQTDHIAPPTPHKEMSSGPRASGVKVPTCGTSWACAYNQHARALNKHTSKQCNLDFLKSGSKNGHQQDANLCGAYARPTDERSLVRGGEEYSHGSFVYFAKACGGCGGSRLSLANTEARPSGTPQTGCV